MMVPPEFFTRVELGSETRLRSRYACLVAAVSAVPRIRVSAAATRAPDSCRIVQISRGSWFQSAGLSTLSSATKFVYYYDINGDGLDNDGGVWTNLANGPLAWPTGAYLNLRFAVQGDRLAVRGDHDREEAGLGIARTFQNIELFENATMLSNLLVGRHRHSTTQLWQELLFLPSVRAREKAHRRSVEQVIEFLARTINRNVRELVGGLNKLIAYAQLTGQEVSLQLAEEQLALLAAIYLETGRANARGDVHALRVLQVIWTLMSVPSPAER